MTDAYTVLEGDCLVTLKTLPKECVDAVVCDPPYGLAFQNAKWDQQVPGPEYWRRIWHRLKPGGHLVAFAGSRTYHRMACAIEDAGFEIRDQLMWLYGSGMPKSRDMSKEMDRLAGAKRAVVAEVERPAFSKGRGHGRDENGDVVYRGMNGGHEGTTQYQVTAPSTDDAKRWVGFGTALKPSHEPVVLARKPITEQTVAANVRKYGTGALNIGGCRIEWGADKPSQDEWNRMGSSGKAGADGRIQQNSQGQKDAYAAGLIKVPDGRWPANVVLSDTGPAELDEQSGIRKSGNNCVRRKEGSFGANGGLGKPGDIQITYGDSGGASRFMYCAKASKRDRRGSTHPTVKPINLMRWLCRLVTPPGGVILDPFAGSGTTGEAALLEGFVPLLCEREPQFAADCRRRLDEVINEISTKSAV